MNKYSRKYYFQLLEVFTGKEIKSRYKASILGPLWIVLYPLLTAIVLNFIFGNFIRIETGNVPYFLFLLTGLLFWNYLQQGINLAKDSFVWNRELIVKAAFPKDVLPLSYVLSKIPDFIVYLILLFLFYLLNGYSPHLWHFFILLILIIPLTLFTAGIAVISALANAIFRDFGRLIEFFLMLLFYATPIVYPESYIPANLGFIVLINPLSLIIVITRELLFHSRFRIDLFFILIFISLLFFIGSKIIFKRFEKNIADLI